MAKRSKADPPAAPPPLAMDSLLLMQTHGHLELTNEVLQEKFERITSGHDRVRERFFGGL